MRVKSLIKSFSFNRLMEEAPKQGWIIPRIADLKGKHVDHKLVWVDDPVPLEDVGTHCYLYNTVTGNKMITNRNNMNNVAVLMVEQKCPHCNGVL